MNETEPRLISREIRPRGWAIGLSFKIDWQLPDDHPYAMAEMHYAYDEEMHPSIEEGLREAIIEHGRKVNKKTY